MAGAGRGWEQDRRQGAGQGSGPPPGGQELDEHALLVEMARLVAQIAQIKAGGMGHAGDPAPLASWRERDRLQTELSAVFRAWSAREERRLRAVLRSTLPRRVGRLDEDDLLQDVFARVFQRPGQYRGTGAAQARAWAAAIARNLALDAVKRYKGKEAWRKDLGDDPESDGSARIDREPDDAPLADARIDREVRELHWPAAVDHCEAHAFALVQTRSPADLYAMGQAANIGTLTSVPKHIRAYRLLRLLHHSPAEAADDLGVARGSVHKLSARGREGLKLGQARALHPTAPEPDPPSREVGSVVPLLHF